MADLQITLAKLDAISNTMHFYYHTDQAHTIEDAIELLKEQSKTIEELEDELHRTENMLNHYLNGNE